MNITPLTIKGRQLSLILVDKCCGELKGLHCKTHGFLHTRANLLLNVTKPSKRGKHLLSIFPRVKQERGRRAVRTLANPGKILEGHLGTHKRKTV